METTSGELQIVRTRGSYLKPPPKRVAKGRQTGYRVIKIIGQGTFGRVYLAETLKRQPVAIKSVLNDERYKCREVEIQMTLNHPNIVKIIDHFCVEKGTEQYTHIVMEYLPDSLLSVFRQCRKDPQRMSPLLRKIYIFQMFKAFAYLHKRRICHRDLKPANILVNQQTYQLKICDFGSAKVIVPNENNLFYMCSRYYRPPELLLGYGNYQTEVDIWSIGCIMVEFFINEPVFPGESSLEQMIQIIKILGTPPKEFLEEYCNLQTKLVLPFIKEQPWKRVLKKFNPQLTFIDLLKRTLSYNVKNRIKANQALLHPFFEDLTKLQNLSVVSSVPGLLDFSEDYWENPTESQKKTIQSFMQMKQNVMDSQKQNNQNASNTTNQG